MPCVRVALVICVMATEMCVALAVPRAMASVNVADKAATADAQEMGCRDGGADAVAHRDGEPAPRGVSGDLAFSTRWARAPWLRGELRPRFRSGRRRRASQSAPNKEAQSELAM